jgi:hypothetical protein
MNIRLKKIYMKEQLEDAIVAIGGETLEGSGFENEQAEQQDINGRASYLSRFARTPGEE